MPHCAKSVFSIILIILPPHHQIPIYRLHMEIYHTTIPDDVKDIDSYVAEKLNIKVGNIYTLCSDEELEIEEL